MGVGEISVTLVYDKEVPRLRMDIGFSMGRRAIRGVSVFRCMILYSKI